MSANSQASTLRINAYCVSHGWLFDDLKRQFAERDVLISDAPLPPTEADAWICIRSSELAKSPCPAQTIVQIHDMHRWRITTDQAACVTLVHPAQQENIIGFHGRTIVVPIGSRPIPSSALPPIPTIGFFCRETLRRGNEIKCSSLFAGAIEEARRQTSQAFEVLLIGYGLEAIAHLGRYQRRAAVPADYARISAFVTLNRTAMVALSAYEACAAGRTVITTPRQWPNPHNPSATEVDQPSHWPMVRTADDADGLAAHIVESVENPKVFEPLRPFKREDWIAHQIDEARSLFRVLARC